jgi:hypothetical protein
MQPRNKGGIGDRLFCDLPGILLIGCLFLVGLVDWLFLSGIMV